MFKQLLDGGEKMAFSAAFYHRRQKASVKNLKMSFHCLSADSHVSVHDI